MKRKTIIDKVRQAIKKAGFNPRLLLTALLNNPLRIKEVTLLSRWCLGSDILRRSCVPPNQRLFERSSRFFKEPISLSGLIDRHSRYSGNQTQKGSGWFPEMDNYLKIINFPDFSMEHNTPLNRLHL